MRLNRFLFAGALFLVAAGVGCVDYLSDSSLFLQEPSGTGGTSGSGGTGGMDPGCVPSGIGTAVDENCGVFVDASSEASGEGTKANPFPTLAKALAQGKTIYVCASAKPLEEALTVDGAVNLYGGLDCQSWVYAAGSKTAWTAPAGEAVATVTLDATLHAEDFTVTAADAAELMPDEHATGRSSIAIVAETESTLELVRCDVMAGKGGDGAAGEPPMAVSEAGAVGEPGADGCDNDMGEFGANGGSGLCPSDVSGGQGGQGNPNMSGGDGTDGNPQPGPTPADGLGGKKQDATACTDGVPGGNGVTGPAGKGAPMESLGSLTAAGFVGVRGTEGTSGVPGQGGGGGGGAKVCLNGKAGPSGAGGGAGGCAGAGGKGGYGGGASIGIASLGATLILSEVKITTKGGGKGGAGASGQVGSAGGAGGMPGTGDAQAKACGGGKGGDGGLGGKGGGGRGGHSIGIAYTGTPPTTGATITPGTAGDGGTGELPDGEGAAGVAESTQAFN